jgi:UDP-N-acetylmuramate: L-alanyl-gamma-D-glutamyl-meso-diaminopimelate ligase
MLDCLLFLSIEMSERMHIHILGVCGTFMGGVAAIAKSSGHHVSGSDSHTYPPMSDTLRALGIDLYEGDDQAQFASKPDLVIIGNALSRGHWAVEYALDQGLPYISGAQWLAEAVLQQRHVIAIAGTHGKTTTTSMLVHILRACDYDPGYLIGGVAHGLTSTAYLGEDYFVIEADEYDTAFFDKRSKFLHYRPRTCVINNIEFDHADIFEDLAAIKRSFSYLLRSVPGNGSVLYPATDKNCIDVIKAGCWSKQIKLHDQQGWQVQLTQADGQSFDVLFKGEVCGHVDWQCIGQHNVMNGLAAIVAAHDIGISINDACSVLSSFKGVKRRMECRGVVNSVTVYDDFAHHPSAIETTLKGLRAHIQQGRVIAVLQFGSNTMKQGAHLSRVIAALKQADAVYLLDAVDLDMGCACEQIGAYATHYPTVQAIVDAIAAQAQPQDHVVVMSNKGFEGIHERLLEALK